MLPYIWGIIFVSYRQESGHNAVCRVLREAISFFVPENENKEVRSCQKALTVPKEMFIMWIKKFIRLRNQSKRSI